MAMSKKTREKMLRAIEKREQEVTEYEDLFIESSDPTDDFKEIFKDTNLVFEHIDKGTAHYTSGAERIKVWFTYEPEDTIRIIEKVPDVVWKKDFRYEVIMSVIKTSKK